MRLRHALYPFRAQMQPESILRLSKQFVKKNPAKSHFRPQKSGGKNGDWYVLPRVAHFCLQKGVWQFSQTPTPGGSVFAQQTDGQTLCGSHDNLCHSREGGNPAQWITCHQFTPQQGWQRVPIYRDRWAIAHWHPPSVWLRQIPMYIGTTLAAMRSCARFCRFFALMRAI